MYVKKALAIGAAAVAGVLAMSPVFAGTGCDAGFNSQYRDDLLLVGSLRPDKPGQVRVFAADGSEFTAGQAQWLHGQVRLIDRACAQGDQVTASHLLDGVHQVLRAHQRVSR